MFDSHPFHTLNLIINFKTMKILREGNINTGICICERCNARLEYTTKDIIGSGKLIADSTISDWVDFPIIQHSWSKYVKDILTKYKDDYVACGYFAKREGYIECPCCGNKIEFKSSPIQTSVYPGSTVTEDGDIDISQVVVVEGIVKLLKSHYNEFTESLE